MLSGKGNISDAKYWSEVSEIIGSTLPREPQISARTHPGSFEVIGDLKQRTVIIYWQKLEEKYHNGPKFGYDIQVKEEEILPSRHTSAYAVFKKLKLDSYTFFVTSKNEIGPAPIASKIFVAHKDELTAIQPTSVTKKYVGENTFEVSWFPPKDNSIIVSYTIFWCKLPQNRRHQCDGILDWIDVKPYPENKTMIHKIRLPDAEHYQIDYYHYQLAVGVTGNTEKYSSGNDKGI